MSEQLNDGAALPPPGQLRWFRIVSPTKGATLRAIILGDTFHGMWTHYANATVPCGNDADCHWCKSALAPRYNGYIPALAGSPGQKRVLALTYHGCCQFTKILKQRGTLRGLEVTLSRKYLSDRAPVLVRVEREIVAQLLPESFNVIDSLSRMWGVNYEYIARGCRRLGADEDAQKYLKDEQERKARPGPMRVFKTDEVG